MLCRRELNEYFQHYNNKEKRQLRKTKNIKTHSEFIVIVLVNK